jgi:hypothetical protein
VSRRRAGQERDRESAKYCTALAIARLKDFTHPAVRIAKKAHDELKKPVDKVVIKCSKSAAKLSVADVKASGGHAQALARAIDHAR